MMDFSTIRTPRNEAEYEAALTTIRPYFENEPDAGTPEAENFDGLFLLIEDYEAKHYPIPDAPPLAIVKYVMEANSYSRGDLAAVLGSKSRASDLLNGKREINLDQIRKLHRAWHIPAGALIGGLDRA